jgi:hypothetical protein
MVELIEREAILRAYVGRTLSSCSNTLATIFSCWLML